MMISFHSIGFSSEQRAFFSRSDTSFKIGCFHSIGFSSEQREYGDKNALNLTHLSFHSIGFSSEQRVPLANIVVGFSVFVSIQLVSLASREQSLTIGSIAYEQFPFNWFLQRVESFLLGLSVTENYTFPFNWFLQRVERKCTRLEQDTQQSVSIQLVSLASRE